MQTIKENVIYQEEIKHSKFITLLYKVNSNKEVNFYLKKVKEDYKQLKRTVLVVLMEEDFPNLENIQEYHTVWHYRE